jgi:hypothetical protein
MTLDLGAIALSMLHVDGWSDRLRYVRSRLGRSPAVAYSETSLGKGDVHAC